MPARANEPVWPGNTLECLPWWPVVSAKQGAQIGGSRGFGSPDKLEKEQTADHPRGA